MKVDGQCHCGKIRFRAEADPQEARICHCTDCQVLSGSPYRAVVRVPAATFEIEGEPSVYVKTADSGAKRAQAFCPVCGSPIYATTVDNPRVYVLRLGTLRQRRELKPAIQIWRRSALAWADHTGELDSLDGQAPT